MPIQRKPPGGAGGKSDGKPEQSQGDGLTPLQRYLAKQKEAEKKAAGEKAGEESKGAGASPNKTQNENFWSSWGEKAGRIRDDFTKRMKGESKPAARDPWDEAEFEAPPSQRPPGPPPPNEPSFATGPDAGPAPQPRATAGFRPADFWPRFAAFLVDTLIVTSVVKGIDSYFLAPFRWALGPDLFGLDRAVYMLIYLAIAYFYYGWFYAEKGASPGKLLLQLEVRDAQSGAKLTYLRAFLRETLGKYISGLPILIGYLIAAFRSDHKALHDLIFDTQVVRASELK